MQKKSKRPHVVIVGAGFGGLKTAQLLAKHPIDITIIDKNNYHLFQPLLYQISTAGLSVDDIAHPIRSIFCEKPNVDFHMAEVKQIDMDKKIIMTDYTAIDYDYLVLAAGGQNNFFGMESISKNTMGMKTLIEAVNIRNHILSRFELAAHEKDEEKRRALLKFVIVGGGPTGVEEAGALSELVYFVLNKEYHTLNFEEVKIILVEATDKVLPTMPEKLRTATINTLIKKNIEVRLCEAVVDYDGRELIFKSGEKMATRTVIWAAGVKAVSLVDRLGCEQDRAGRAIVDEYLQLPNKKDVFAVGDMANFMQDGASLAMIAPVAMQQADIAAENVLALIKNKPLKKFRYKSVGAMATIGRNDAVVSMGSYTSEGLVAWLMWSVIHIWRLIDFRSRIVIFLKWIWYYIRYDRMARIITRN